MGTITDSGVSIYGKLDLQRSRPLRESVVATYATDEIAEEGLALIGVYEDGVLKARVSAAGASENFIGVSKNDVRSVGTVNLVEEGTIPAVAPYTYNLPVSNISPGLIRVIRTDTGAALTEAGGAPADGEFSLDDTTGILTFNVAQAGIGFKATYRYIISAAEARRQFGDGHVNRGSSLGLNQVTVLEGGVIFTMQYNPTSNFVTAAGAATAIVRTGANGLFVVGGAGTAVGRVISVPSANDPFLGIQLNALTA